MKRIAKVRHIRPGRVHKHKLGERFGRLVIASDVPIHRLPRVFWKCRCDCGKDVIVWGVTLRTGKSRSCGCIAVEITRQRSLKHGEGIRGKTTPEYRAWKGMIQRCRFRRSYIALGIRVHPDWETSFEAFLKDVGRRPSRAYSLDRKNGKGHYEPGNVRWATPKEQGRNHLVHRFLTVDGRTLPASEWAEIAGLNYGTLLSRLERGWSNDRAVKTPTQAEVRG